MLGSTASLKQRAHYYVVIHENRWKITLNGKHFGPFSTQQDAIDEAVRCAHQAHKDGFDAQVLVQGADNRFRTEWTYGHDPYPPRG